MAETKDRQKKGRGLSAVAICVVIVLASLFFCLQEVKAVTVTTSAKTGYRDGYFYVTICDESGQTTKCKISLLRDKDPQYNDVVGEDGRNWTCSMTVEGTNYHNVKLNTTSARTQPDVENKRSVLVFSLTYTQHAYYMYKGYEHIWDTKHSGGRFDPVQYEAAKADILSVPQGVVLKDTQRTITVCSHAAHTGVLSFKYNGTDYRSLGEEIKITYAKPSYKVQFMDAGGSAYCTRTVTCGEKAVPPEKAPERTGYTFTGWQQDFSCITKNLDVYPGWKEIPKKKYRIQYDANGGVGNMAVQTVMRDEKVQLAPYGYMRAGYTFCGWSTDSEDVREQLADGSEVENLAEADQTVTLYAVWKKTDASFDTDTLLHDEDMFTGDGNLQGESGTGYNRYHVDSSYARVDETKQPGYFSRE